MESDDANKYIWVDSEILGTISILSDPTIVSMANIIANRLSDWLVLPVE